MKEVVRLEMNLELGMSVYSGNTIPPKMGPRCNLQISVETDHGGLAYVKEGLEALCDSWKLNITNLPEGGEVI